MRKEAIISLLEKYDISETNVKKLAKHLTYLKEHIEADIPKKFGDLLNIRFSLTYTFDNKEYNVSFYQDFSGNAAHYTFDCEPFSDDNNIHSIFLNAVCDFLDNNYEHVS